MPALHRLFGMGRERVTPPETFLRALRLGGQIRRHLAHETVHLFLLSILRCRFRPTLKWRLIPRYHHKGSTGIGTRINRMNSPQVTSSDALAMIADSRQDVPLASR